jgi:hypothetical protein
MQLVAEDFFNKNLSYGCGRVQIAHVTWRLKLLDDRYPWVSAPRNYWLSYVSKKGAPLFFRATDMSYGEKCFYPLQPKGKSTLLVAQLVEALRYNPEVRGFNFSLCHWYFLLT